MSIIKNKDIYDPSQGNPLQPILDVLELMDKKILESANVMKKLEAALRGVQNTGTGAGAQELTEATEKLNKETQKLIATEKAKEQIEKQLAATQAKLLLVNEESVKQIKQNQVELNAINRKRTDEYRLLSENVGQLQKYRIELKNAKNELLSAKEGTEEYNKALKKAANIYDELSDAQKRIAGTSMDFEGISGNITKTLGGLASGFEAVQGAQALMGIESEDLQKSLVKVQAAMAVANGLQGLDGLAKNARNLWTQLRQTTVVTKLVTAAQWLWNAAIAANPVTLLISGLVALGAAAYGIIKYFNSSAESIDKERIALDGVVLGTKEAVEAHNEHIKTMQDLDVQLRVTSGTITDFEGKILSLAATYNASLEQISKDSQEKLEKNNGFWNVLWNTIKSGGDIAKGVIETASGAADIIVDKNQKIIDSQAELNKRIDLLRKEQDKQNKERYEKAYKDQLEAEKKHQEELFQLQRDYKAKLGLEYEAKIDGQIQAQIDNETQIQNDLDAIRQVESEKQANRIQEDIDRANKKFEEQKEIMIAVGTEAGNLLGEMIAKGELSIKDFGKFILATTIDMVAKQILLLEAELFARQVAQKGFVGIATSALLIGATQAFFAGIRAKVLSLSEGTEYVNGAGTETSDSVPARLSKGERVVPAYINKQLAGISNKDLPGIIYAGLNTMRMEKILSNVNENTSITAQYLSNGVSSWQDAQYRYYRDNKTGLTHRISLYGN